MLNLVLALSNWRAEVIYIHNDRSPSLLSSPSLALAQLKRVVFVWCVGVFVRLGRPCHLAPLALTLPLFK